LLTAYGLNQHKITGKIAKTALKELEGRKPEGRSRPLEGKWGVIVFSALCLILLLTLVYPPNFIDLQKALQFRKNTVVTTTRPIPSPDVSPIPDESQKTTEAPQPERPMIAPPVQPIADEPLNTTDPQALKTSPVITDSVAPVEAEIQQQQIPESEPLEVVALRLGDFLVEIDPVASRQTAFEAATNLWRISPKIKPHLHTIEDSDTFFRLAAKQNGLTAKRIVGNLRLIEKLNVPAILEFTVPNGASTEYLTLSRIDYGTITLLSGIGRQITTSTEELKTYWSGAAYILWKNFLACTGEIPNHASEDSVITLKMILKDVGFDHITIDPVYDQPTQDAVKEVQRKHGLTADGVVGTLTKIVLYNEYKSFDIPHIRMN
jgi:general secretion pathway protein A